ncbi:MAG: hypothetical protein ACYC4P_09485 [Thermoanaerobaculia bacterium]
MKRSRLCVLAALAVVGVLGGGLWYRTRAIAKERYPWPEYRTLPRCTDAAPAARVPAPKAVGRLELPGGSPATGHVTFRNDLDVLAPLGDGPGNAALWFKDFTKGFGFARTDEADAAWKARVDGPADLGADLAKVLPPDHPLLREAEAWADQSTMRFHPEFFPSRGWTTPIPNLLLSLTFAKSWVARALSDPGAPTAADDCRRAIRWGRLLRQDDVTVIQDFIGLACIRIGAQGLYDLAARRGDLETMLAASVVVGEQVAQRLLTIQRLKTISLLPVEGLAVTDEKLGAMAEMAKARTDRRFRSEAILALATVRAKGMRHHRQRAQEILDSLAGEKDPVLAPVVAWARVSSFTKEELDSILGK